MLFRTLDLLSSSNELWPPLQSSDLVPDNESMDEWLKLMVESFVLFVR